MTVTLDKMQLSLQQGKSYHTPHLCTLLDNRITACRQLLAELKAVLATLSPAVVPTYERLVSILRSLAAANTRSKVCNPMRPTQDFILIMSSSHNWKLKHIGLSCRKYKIRWGTENLSTARAIQAIAKILPSNFWTAVWWWQTLFWKSMSQKCWS